MTNKLVYAPLGYQQITDVSASVGLTSPPAGAKAAIIQAEDQAVRWRDDGVAPTDSVGMLIPAGSELVYDGAMSSIRFIEAAAGATLNVSFYA